MFLIIIDLFYKTKVSLESIESITELLVGITSFLGYQPIKNQKRLFQCVCFYFSV